MRKMAMLVGILMLSSSCVFAMPDRVGKVDAGFQVGGLLPDGNAQDAAVYYGGSMSYGVYDWLGVGIEGGYADTTTDFNIGGSNREGHINRVPFFVDLIFRYTKPEYEYAPYAVLGLGGLFADTSGTGTFTNGGLKLDVENSFAMKFGVGVDWFLNDKWMANLEASYVWVDEEAKVTRLSNGTLVDSSDMSYWQVGGGFKYLFE